MLRGPAATSNCQAVCLHLYDVDLLQARALRRAGLAAAAGLFCNAAGADKNASAHRRRR